MFNSMNKLSYIKQPVVKLYAKLPVVLFATFFKNDNLQKISCDNKPSSVCSFSTSTNWERSLSYKFT